MRGLIKGLIVELFWQDSSFCFVFGFQVCQMWMTEAWNLERNLGEPKNPEINALKKPQKTSKVGEKLILENLEILEKIAKIVQKSEEK